MQINEEVWFLLSLDYETCTWGAYQCNLKHLMTSLLGIMMEIVSESSRVYVRFQVYGETHPNFYFYLYYFITGHGR